MNANLNPSWIFKMILNAACIILWILPYTFILSFGEEKILIFREIFYFYYDDLMPYFLMLFMPCWLIYQVSNLKWLKLISKFLLILSSGIMFFYSLGIFLFAYPHTSAYFGFSSLLILLPLLIIIFILESREKKNISYQSTSRILDADLDFNPEKHSKLEFTSNILERLGLIETIVIEHEMSKLDFYRKFKERINAGDSSYMETNYGGKIWLEKPNDNKYVGICEFHKFRIQKSAPFRKRNTSYPIIRGKVEQEDEKIKITAKIYGVHWRNFFILLLICLVPYSAFSIYLQNIPRAYTLFIYLFSLFILITYNFFKTRKLVCSEEWDIRRELTYGVLES